MKRKSRKRARAASEHHREEFERCEQGIATFAFWRRVRTQKPGAQNSKREPHFATQPIERLQSKGEIFGGRSERKPGQQCLDERPKHCCRHGMAREDAGQKNRKRMPAPRTLVAVGTVDALSAFHLSSRAVGIVAIKNAMTNEGSRAGTVRAPYLLERKSRAARAGTSRTKRIQEGNISHCCRVTCLAAEHYFDGTAKKRDSGKKQSAKTDGTENGALPTLRS